MKLFKNIISIGSCFYLLSCDSGGTGAPVDIPIINIECSTSKCFSAASGSYPAVVTLSLSGCAQSQVAFDTVAVSSLNVSCINGVSCTGTTSSWGDKNSNTITQVISRSYYVCAYIDLNLNTPDASDAFSDENRSVTASSFTISDWGASFVRSL